MCNLYSITTNQASIIALFRVVNRYVGNLPPMPGVFPDYPAPLVRNAGTERELIMMRWGMPPAPRCACRKSNPDILVVLSTQDRTAKGKECIQRAERGAVPAHPCSTIDAYVEDVVRLTR
jgi:putative SOS response-associated peptidase YedK